MRRLSSSGLGVGPFLTPLCKFCVRPMVGGIYGMVQLKQEGARLE